MQKIKYSVIIPVFNESGNLKPLYTSLTQVMKKIDKSYELIFIDDGSTDNTNEILLKLKRDEHTKVYTLRKNSGKSLVYNLGFQKATGDIIITLDADMQDKPSEIPKLIKTLGSQFDFVVGWRKKREDTKSKIIGSLLFNKLVSLIFKSKFHDMNCGLKIFKSQSVKSIYLYGDFHRFLPLLMMWNGYKGTETEIRHSQRLYGKSKYSILRVFNSLYDLFSAFFMFRFAQKPMHFFGAAGLSLLVPGILINLYLTWLKINGLAIGGRPLLFLGILLTLTGIQFITTGFIADLIIRSKTDNFIKNIIRE